MSDEVEFDPEKLLTKVSKLEERNHLLTLEKGRVTRRNAKLSAEIDALQAEVAATKDALALPALRPPKWMVKAPTGKKHHVIPTLLLSDLHWDETVRPEQLGGINAYNRKIAEARLRVAFETSIKNRDTYMPSFVHDGITVGAIGDLVTGTIHGMALTNDSPSMMDTCVNLAENLIAGFEMLTEAYGSVYGYFLPGNHDRNDIKVPTKNQAELAWTWIVGRWVAHHFKNSPKVNIVVPKGEDLRYSLYGTRFKAQHGHALSGGRDLEAALKKVTAQRRERDSKYGQAYDVDLMGHFHTYVYTQRIVANGSLKGPDEYTRRLGYDLDPPVQAFFWTTPERGMTFGLPIDCRSPKEAKLWTPEGIAA